MSTLTFYVNGKKIEEVNPDPEWTLLFYLRKKLGLCGTKLGCGEGGCGACTVMVSKYDRQEKKPIHLAVNACLAPVCAMHGLAVTTIEGIGSTKTRLHPAQERIAKAHGSQCGFCTPGIVMSMYTLLRSKPKLTIEDLEVAFQGNLCRCTGYRPIIEGYKSFIEDWELNKVPSSTVNGCAKGDKCCKVTGKSCEPDEPDDLFIAKNFIPYDSSQEPIFPPELMLNQKYDAENLTFNKNKVAFYRPTSLEELLQLKHQHNNAKIVTGNTEVGIEVKFKGFQYPVIINPSQVKELNNISVMEHGVIFGASVTLSTMEDKLKSLIETLPLYKTKIFKAIVDMLHWFAGKQIRNVSAVGGNIMTGSPISDLNPIFMAANAELHLKSQSGERKISMDHTFFTGYRKNAVSSDEILVSITIPYTRINQHFKAYKQAKRRDDDIAIVNMALNVGFKEDLKISELTIAFGDMAPVTTIARETCKLLIGEYWNENMVQKAHATLLNELNLDPAAPGGMIRYRQSLTLSLFFKAFIEISQDISTTTTNKDIVSARDKSAIGGFKHNAMKSSQYFMIPSDKQSQTDPVGRPIVHMSALKQATGEAVYVDDMPPIEGELYLALVLSTRPHAKLISIDESEAMKMDGVVAFYSAKDLDEKSNHTGPIYHDEEVFRSKLVQSQGQVLGAIVAIDQTTAQRAAKAVKVTYENIEPVIISIEDAIKQNSYYPGYPVALERGKTAEAMVGADHIIEEDMRVGGQEHFYLETQVARAVPKKEDDEMEIFYSGQHPTEISKLVANMLGVHINRIYSRVKRIGGGFGGKESRSILVALPVAFAAHKLQKPVRCMLDRDEDMLITGNRHPFYFKYKIGVMKDGTIVAADIAMYNNAGYSFDLSSSVLERAICLCDNAYFVPNIKITGYLCKTNLPSNTAFRGFGGPQGMMFMENAIRNIAYKLKMDPIEITTKNFYKEGQLTHYNQELSYCTLQRCWDECIVKSDYHKRKAEIDDYNSQNWWKKRGICILPTKFGIAFSINFLNQAGALIHVYTDGSVLLSHAGTEMGQGLHTKMLQVASRVLNIDISKIYISDTSTDKVPNTSPTAASVSSDLNGMAVINACNIIMERLKPFMEKCPDDKWEDWVSRAYLNCVSLSAAGYYYTPGIGYDLATNTGRPYNYFSYGAACSEVEIDCLTGDHRVIRTDIVMDVGESLNPAIDVGQIEGAFIQGYGLFTMEELIYSPTGTLYSRGPGAYKLPGFSDIPEEFNVSLLKGAPNPRAVYSSKAVGEPPLFLAAAVFYAIKEAIKAYRKLNGKYDDFKFYSPATAENIRMACEDSITSKVKQYKEGTYTPWNVAP